RRDLSARILPHAPARARAEASTTTPTMRSPVAHRPTAPEPHQLRGKSPNPPRPIHHRDSGRLSPRSVGTYAAAAGDAFSVADLNVASVMSSALLARLTSHPRRTRSVGS